MAGFTRTHGDAQPVFAIDTQNGPIAPSAAANGTTTNFIGPAMQFFGVDLGAAPTDQLGVDEMIAQVLVSVEQLSTVMIYQVQASSAANNLSMALYPVGAYTTATLQAQIRALGTVNGYDLSGAVVTDTGFKLAAS